MPLSKLALCLALFGLVACAKSGNSSSPTGPAAEPDLEQLSNDYTQNAELHIVRTGGEINKTQSNLLSVKGQGAKSTYKLVYRFNSGSANSLYILETTIAEQGSSCQFNDVISKLKGNGQEFQMTRTGRTPVQPNTDYTLELAVKHNCKELNFTIDMLVWAGSSLEEPQIGKVCRGEKVLQAEFLQGMVPYEMYSSISGARTFLNSETYCGEKFRGDTRKCASSLTNVTSSSEVRQDTERSSCTAERGNESRSFSIEFNLVQKTAFIRCDRNGKETFSETFTSCRDHVLDANALRSQ